MQSPWWRRELYAATWNPGKKANFCTTSEYSHTRKWTIHSTVLLCLASELWLKWIFTGNNLLCVNILYRGNIVKTHSIISDSVSGEGNTGLPSLPGPLSTTRGIKLFMKPLAWSKFPMSVREQTVPCNARQSSRDTQSRPLHPLLTVFYLLPIHPMLVIHILSWWYI